MLLMVKAVLRFNVDLDVGKQALQMSVVVLRLDYGTLLV